MATEDDAPMVAAAAVGGHANLWARQGREALQGSHTLTAPLARWAPEPLPPEQTPVDPNAQDRTDIAIPEAVLHARLPLKLPEDSVCRSPIAGLVVAVMATEGQHIDRGQTVLVIEAMKMLNHVSPAVEGAVKAMHVAPGDAVKAGQVLFELG